MLHTTPIILVQAHIPQVIVLTDFLIDFLFLYLTSIILSCTKYQFETGLSLCAILHLLDPAHKPLS